MNWTQLQWNGKNYTKPRPWPMAIMHHIKGFSLWIRSLLSSPDSNSKSSLAVSFLRYKLEMGLRAVYIQQQLRKSNSWHLWKKKNQVHFGYDHYPKCATPHFIQRRTKKVIFVEELPQLCLSSQFVSLSQLGNILIQRCKISKLFIIHILCNFIPTETF